MATDRFLRIVRRRSSIRSFSFLYLRTTGGVPAAEDEEDVEGVASSAPAAVAVAVAALVGVAVGAAVGAAGVSAGRGEANPRRVALMGLAMEAADDAALAVR